MGVQQLSPAFAATLPERTTAPGQALQSVPLRALSILGFNHSLRLQFKEPCIRGRSQQQV